MERSLCKVRSATHGYTGLKNAFIGSNDKTQALFLCGKERLEEPGLVICWDAIYLLYIGA